jgi:glycosyltransferase involved in cell wall biosynthesis
VLLCIVLGISLYAIAVFSNYLRNTAISAPTLTVDSVSKNNLAKLSVIIPAYNEAANIAGCIQSVLESSDLTSEQLEVWVVDDQSTDETLAIAQQFSDPRLQILQGTPRPVGEVWMGKNWACTQVVPKTTGEYLLFLDADVTLKPGGLEKALTFAQENETDLLTFWMTIACECFAERIAQPIIAGLIAVGHSFAEVNDPDSETVFAVGPFMLFRRTAYEQIGGHQGVAEVVLEDVTLGRRIKEHRLKLWYGLGHDLASVRMYRSFAALWEGWTKNIHLATNRNIRATLYAALAIFLVFAMPWLGLLLLPFSQMKIFAGLLILLELALQYRARLFIQRLTNIFAFDWWLGGIGGIVVTAIALVSVIKVETGWGWTWRGRSLVSSLEHPQS